MLLTLIGPIDGINLRNLLWHGFLKPEEFETHFTSFLIMAILSLDKINDLLYKNKEKRRPLNVVFIISMFSHLFRMRQFLTPV